MKIEIDQSGKIEDTARNTIVAFSNSKSYSIKLESETKRKLQLLFRQHAKTKIFIYKIFAAMIYLLISRHINKITHVVIDIEYQGHELLIKDLLIRYLKAHNLPVPYIDFQRIGNKPKVHYVAYNTFIGARKADRLIDFDTILKVIKKDRGIL